ncbi:MAG: class B sortase [Eubacteriales bacterium]|nr:class B sortase [Eubacteriales bacterium]
MKDREPKKKKKKRAGDVLLTLILIGAIGVFLYAAYNLYHIYTEYKKGSDEYNSIAQMAVTERDPDQQEEGEEPSEKEAGPGIKPPMEIDFDALRSVNQDVIGWIYVEALDGVSYPIVKGTDNSYYLHMTYEKNYNFAGTIFIDYENSGDFSDCNTLVYGHNMKNGSMFGQLKNFSKNEETYRKSKYFWIFTPEKSYRYEIISAYVTAVDSGTYTLFKGPGKEFQEYLDTIVGFSEIETTPGTLSIEDKIVTLSTCTGNQATRYVVQGKRVDTVDAKAAHGETEGGSQAAGQP